MDLDTKRKWVLRVILQAQQTACHKDQPLQHIHIHHKLEDHHGLPQSTIRTQITRILPEHNGTTNTSTRAPVGSDKGPAPSKRKEQVVRTPPWNIIRHRFCYTTCWSHNSMFSMWQKWPLDQKLPLL